MERAVQPPVWEQVNHYLGAYNGGATLFAEMLDGYLRTPFEFTFDGQELYAEDGSPLGSIFEDAIIEAEQLATLNPSLAFEVRRRHIERGEYGIMIDMAKGKLPNTVIILSDFPPELMNTTQSVGGYNVNRKQTMLRVLSWRGGRMHMHSQSLDGSNRQALEAIYAQFGQTPQPGELLGQRIHVDLSEEEQSYVTDRLTGVYDRSLQQQNPGSNYYAGRQDERHDTYQFVRTQHELLDRYATAKLEGILTDELIYDMAALLDKKFEQSKRPELHIFEEIIAFNGLLPALEVQLRLAGKEARLVGKTFDACGVSVGSTTAEDQLGGAGYGNKADKDEDKYGSLEFTCTKGHYNRRKPNKLIDNCKQCGEDVSCKKPETSTPKVKPILMQKTLFRPKSNQTGEHAAKRYKMVLHAGGVTLATASR